MSDDETTRLLPSNSSINGGPPSPKNEKKSPSSRVEKYDDVTDNLADMSDVELSMKDLRRLRNMCFLEHTKHRLAQQKLAFKNFWMFTLTTVTITMAAGIASFIAGSEIVSDQTGKYLAVIVGAMSFFNIFLQKISRTTKYDSRSDMHHSAAIDFCLLASDIDFRMIATKSKLEKAKRLKNKLLKKRKKQEANKTVMAPSASNGIDANDTSEETQEKARRLKETRKEQEAIHTSEETPEQSEEMDRVIHGYNTAIKQVVSGCKSLMPQDIDQTFELCLADYRMQTFSEAANKKLLKLAGKRSPNLMGALVTECGMLIATTRWWPVWDVKPKAIVKKAYENLNAKAPNNSPDHLLFFMKDNGKPLHNSDKYVTPTNQRNTRV